jgi:FtsZ-binding cell division protein ZapB
MTKKSNENEAVDQDDDPTAELEALPEEACTQDEPAVAVEPEPALEAFSEIEPDDRVEPELAADTIDFAGLDAELGDTKNTISSLKAEIRSRAQAISILQFELEQLRTHSAGLEKEVMVSEELIRHLGDELKSAKRRQISTEELLRVCDKEIESLKSQLSDKGQSTPEPVPEITEADTGNELHRAGPESTSAQIEEFERDIRKSREIVTAVRNQRTTDSPVTACDDADTEPHPLRMIVARNTNTSNTYPIKSGSLSLGSSPDNDIQISSSFISRHHAQIVSNGAECVLKDMNSTNGTYINSKRIKRHALRNGDLIVMGKHRFEFVEQHRQPCGYKTDTRDTRART